MEDFKKNKEFKATLRYAKFLKPFVYSKILLIVLLLLIQFSIFVVFLLRFEKYINYFWGSSLSLGILFLIYLSNSPGKNEFKLAWIVPVIVLPIFGISLYFMYKVNFGRNRLKKSLKAVELKSDYLLQDLKESSEACDQYPKVKDIAMYLQNTSSYPAYINTKKTYFPSGELAFEDIKKELEKAKKFIFIEYFIIEPSQIWDEIFNILCKRADNGVEIRILYDSLGSSAFSTRRYEKYLEQRGIKAKVFMPFVPVFDAGLNNRDHRKILIIDGQSVYTGGINISDEYANLKHNRFEYWKDIAIKLEGSAVRTFSIMFLQLWNVANRTVENEIDYKKFTEIKYESKKNLGVSIPYGDDAFNGEDVAENVYNYILSKSHNYVHIMTPYIIIDNTMMNSLLFAAKRNVEISIIVPQNYDHLITFCVGRTFIKTLVEKGVHVYEYNPGFIHAKLFVSDNNRATVGSINLDYRSLFHHFECGVFLYRSPVINDIELDFQNTLKDCTPITLKEYKKLPIGYRVIGWFFRIFAPLL